MTHSLNVACVHIYINFFLNIYGNRSVKLYLYIVDVGKGGGVEMSGTIFD